MGPTAMIWEWLALALKLAKLRGYVPPPKQLLCLGEKRRKLLVLRSECFWRCNFYYFGLTLVNAVFTPSQGIDRVCWIKKVPTNQNNMCILLLFHLMFDKMKWYLPKPQYQVMYPSGFCLFESIYRIVHVCGFIFP